MEMEISEDSHVADVSGAWAPSVIIVRHQYVWLEFTSHPLNIYHTGFVLELAQEDVNGEFCIFTC